MNPMTRSPALRDRARASAVAVTLLAITLSGCTAGTSSADPTPAVTPVAADPPSGQLSADPITGTGPSPYPGTAFPLNDGARSVVVEFACEGGHPFSVELGDSMAQGQAPLSGTCDGLSELAWPLTGRVTSTLSIVIPEGVEWSATPLFSTAPFPTDPLIAIECEAFSTPLSAIVNAESGFTTYAAFDVAEWERRMDGAAERLDQLADLSTTVLADSFAQLAEVAADRDRIPGDLLISTDGAVSAISEACNQNQTPFSILAEFGG